MKTVIIVSKCLEVITTLSNPYAEFKFKGTLEGEEIEDIGLYYPKHIKIQKGKEYLMHVELEDVYNGSLLGTIIKAKTLEVGGEFMELEND